MLLLKRLSRLSFQFKLEIFFQYSNSWLFFTPHSSPSLSLMRLWEVVLKHWIYFGGKRRKNEGISCLALSHTPDCLGLLPLPATTSITTTKMWKWEEKICKRKYFRSVWCVNVISHAFMSRFWFWRCPDITSKHFYLKVDRFLFTFSKKRDIFF